MRFLFRCKLWLQLNVCLISMHSKWILFEIKSFSCISANFTYYTFTVLSIYFTARVLPTSFTVSLHIFYCTCTFITFIFYCITCTVKAMYGNRTALTLQCTVPLPYCQNIFLYYRFTVNILYFPVLYGQYLVHNLYPVVNIMYYAVHILKYKWTEPALHCQPLALYLYCTVNILYSTCTCTINIFYWTCAVLSISWTEPVLYCQYLVLHLYYTVNILYWTCPVLSISCTEPVLYCKYLVLNLYCTVNILSSTCTVL